LFGASSRRLLQRRRRVFGIAAAAAGDVEDEYGEDELAVWVAALT
jgi:hypothetical protein